MTEHQSTEPLVLMSDRSLWTCPAPLWPKAPEANETAQSIRDDWFGCVVVVGYMADNRHGCCRYSSLRQMHIQDGQQLVSA